MSEWQPIETAPKDEVAIFWVRPGTIDDGEWYADTSGKPILRQGPARMFVGKYAAWSSLTVATHWHPMPSPPTSNADGQQK